MIDSDRHETKGRIKSPREEGDFYEVFCFLFDDPYSFDYKEAPLFITVDRKHVYMHEILERMETDYERVEYVHQQMAMGRKVARLVYKKEEKQKFLDKYFEYLI